MLKKGGFAGLSMTGNRNIFDKVRRIAHWGLLLRALWLQFLYLFSMMSPYGRIVKENIIDV
jgi:hypothetical protein